MIFTFVDNTTFCLVQQTSLIINEPSWPSCEYHTFVSPRLTPVFSTFVSHFE
uniref:Uncharacterized protein n=1 Tax=Anguilla anguilla TaxID=7936 RepID=A0A0E9QPP1_ANGAN